MVCSSKLTPALASGRLEQHQKIGERVIVAMARSREPTDWAFVALGVSLAHALTGRATSSCRSCPARSRSIRRRRVRNVSRSTASTRKPATGSRVTRSFQGLSGRFVILEMSILKLSKYIRNSTQQVTNPRIRTSAEEMSVPASNARWIRMNSAQVVLRLRSGAGGIP